MTRTSVYSDQKFDVYEEYEVSRHLVTASEASANAIEIASVEPHAVVRSDGSGSAKYARGYADGVEREITSVTYSAMIGTTVAFTSLVEGEIVDIYFPVTGTGCGSLVSNTDTGKLTLPRLQSVRNWNVAANKMRVPECGTKRKRRVMLVPSGSVVLGLNRFGNTAMADFIAARKGKSNGDKIYLLFDEVDTTTVPHTHILLHRVRVQSYRRVSNASNSLRGIITDTITASFTPHITPYTEP